MPMSRKLQREIDRLITIIGLDNAHSPYLMGVRPSSELLATEEGFRELFIERCCDPYAVAFTITYKQSLRLAYDANDLRILTYRTFYYLNISKFLMLPDMDASGNYHLHGVVNLRASLRGHIKTLITHLLGYCKFQYIDDNIKWWAYCRKDTSTMKELGMKVDLKDHDFVYDYNELIKNGVYDLKSRRKTVYEYYNTIDNED